MKTISRRTFLRHAGAASLLASVSPLQVFSFSQPHRVCIRRSRLSMGSCAEMFVYGESRVQCMEAINSAFKEFDRIEKLMSVFDQNSQLSRINSQSYKNEVDVDSRILEVLGHAKKYYELTDGAFDVTIEPLMEVYGFRDRGGDHHFPSDRQIAEVLDGVGMNNVSFDRKRSSVVLLHSKTRLDFGGIAVGYAIDSAVSILRSYGITSAFVNHSGDIFAIGAPPDDDAWGIGITDPLQTGEVITTVRIKDQALSTTGNYQNSIDLDGTTIGHILDPRTGSSVANMLSGTVIAPIAIEADACSTALFVLGVEKARESLQRVKNLQVLAVSEKRDVFRFSTYG